MLYKKEQIKNALFYNDRLYIILLCILNVIWFFSYIDNGIIMGDDIDISVYRYLNLEEAFVSYGSKYRPIYTFFAILTAHLFDNCYELYFCMNIAVNCLVTVALYCLIKRIVKDRKNVSFVMSVLFVISPFLYYNILQILGLMEALCLCLLLAVFYFSFLYLKGKNNAIYPAIFVAILLTFTHERYIVITPWLIILIMCQEYDGLRKRIMKAAISLLPLLINVLLKKLIFQSEFLVGTGGTSISFDLVKVISFFCSGLMSIVGVNNGPEYLVGIGFSQYPTYGKIMAIIVVIFSFAILLTYITQTIVLEQDKKSRIREIKYSLIASSAIGALLISGCVTIRLEQRWITAPFIAYLLYFGYIISRIHLKYECIMRNILLSVLIIGNISVSWLQHSAVGNIYFSRAMQIAQNFYSVAIEEYGETLSDYVVYLIGNNELKWAVGRQDFSMFDVYLDQSVEFKYADTIEEIKLDYMEEYPDKSKPIKIFQIDNSLNVSEIQNVVIDLNCESKLNEYVYVVTPDTFADTPNGEGVFSSGENSFTILSGYEKTIKDVVFTKNSVLYFESCMPYENSDGAYVSVTLVRNNNVAELSEFSVYPKEGNSENTLININNNEEFVADIKIEVQSPSGDMTADWVTFANAGIYTWINK